MYVEWVWACVLATATSAYCTLHAHMLFAC